MLVNFTQCNFNFPNSFHFFNQTTQRYSRQNTSKKQASTRKDKPVHEKTGQYTKLVWQVDH